MDTEAKRRQRRKDARPAELIEAGLAEFSMHGFAGTRLDDVARRAGVVKGTIYRYFADKEALFIAAVRSRVVPAFDEIATFVDAFPGSTRDLLHFVLNVAHRQIGDPDVRTLMRIIIAEGERFPDLTELYYRETISKGMVLIDRILKRGIARGDVRDGPVARMPMVIAAPVLMAAIWQMSFQRHAPIAPDAFLAAHLDLVFNGILAGENPTMPAGVLES